MEKIFVYGSLRQDFWNHDKVLKHRTRKVQTGFLKGYSLYHLPAGYPAIVTGSDLVHGEVYTLSHPKHLKSIDLLEGYTGDPHKDLYKREQKTIILDNGEEALCWVYLYIDEMYVKNTGKYIPYGDWKKFMIHNPSYR